MMLYTKIQPLRFLGSGEEDILLFLPYMVMSAILINRPFVQMFNASLKKAPQSLKKTGLRVSEEKSCKGVNRGRTASDHNSLSWAFGSGELIMYTPVNPSFYYIKVRFKRVKII